MRGGFARLPRETVRRETCSMAMVAVDMMRGKDGPNVGISASRPAKQLLGPGRLQCFPRGRQGTLGLPGFGGYTNHLKKPEFFLITFCGVLKLENQP